MGHNELSWLEGVVEWLKVERERERRVGVRLSVRSCISHHISSLNCNLLLLHNNLKSHSRMTSMGERGENIKPDEIERVE